jgi:hypothetical protein
MTRAAAVTGSSQIATPSAQRLALGSQAARGVPAQSHQLSRCQREDAHLAALASSCPAPWAAAR